MSILSSNHSSSTKILLLLSPFLLITLTYLIFSGNNFRLQSEFMSISCETPSKSTKNTSVAGTLHLFLGILTVPHLHERRNLLRTIYAVDRRNLNSAYVDVRFVFCHSMNEEEKMFLSLEIMRYNDIIILDCFENMNEGKTYTYFSSLPFILAGDNRPEYDYVIKTDDDAYFRLDNLAKFLSNKPREDLYYGMELSCVGAQAECGVNKTFMAGFGYVLSWDLVKWIAETDIARDNKIGLEDMMLGKWLNMADKGKNRYNGMPDQLYDYKGDSPDGYFKHDFVPGTVAIHKLKENLHWAKTMEYFNVTHGVGLV